MVRDREFIFDPRQVGEPTTVNGLAIVIGDRKNLLTALPPDRSPITAYQRELAKLDNVKGFVRSPSGLGFILNGDREGDVPTKRAVALVEQLRDALYPTGIQTSIIWERNHDARSVERVVRAESRASHEEHVLVRFHDAA